MVQPHFRPDDIRPSSVKKWLLSLALVQVVYQGCFLLRGFDFVISRGEEFNQLYKMGFSRVGCAPCINAGKEDVTGWATRFPEMIDKVRQWEQEVGRTFFAPMVPGMEINWVDEVVAWAKTTRGGKQLALPFAQAEADAGSCSSKYGLCE